MSTLMLVIIVTGVVSGTAILTWLISQQRGKAHIQAQQLTQLQEKCNTWQQQWAQEQTARVQAERKISELTTRLEEQQRHNDAVIQQLHDNKTLLKQAFSNLANDILEAKSQVLSQQHTEQLTTLLKPFNEQLQGFRRTVDEARREDHAGRAALKQQLETLYTLNQQITDEAGQLAKALKGDKKLQGHWGEIQVERILENSGLIKEKEYRREANFKDPEGRNRRPDFVVYLPEGKHLVIDSKVSLVDYIAYVNADDDQIRQQSLTRHIQCIRNHIHALSEQDYAHLTGITAPDFVFLFMPLEPALTVALQQDQQLFHDASEQSIVVVTATTLLATLRTVASLWTIERQNANARQLADRASLVYDKLRVFVEKMEKLDAQLTTARSTYDDAMNTLKQGRGNLLAQTHAFLNLGVRIKKQLPGQTLDTANLLDDVIE